jgi:stage V sporulation protein G
MKVEATVYLNEGESKIKANASIKLEDCFVVKGLRIIEGSNGLFTAMPSKKNASGDYVDVCFPVTAEARAAINDEILRAYYEKLGQQEEQSVPAFMGDDLPF